MQPVLCRWILPLLLLAVFLLSSCASGVSKQTSRPLQIPQHIPVADITHLVANSLGQLNYAVVEMNPAAGYVRAERYVPNDVWNRVTRIRVDVVTGYMGGKMLNIEASSCPGCIPQATYDPDFMINEFSANFDAWLRSSTRYAMQQPPSQNAQPDISQKEPQAEPALMPPASPQSRKAGANRQPAAPQPALRLNSLEITPGIVPPGSKFDVVTDYLVFDPELLEGKVTVQFALSILRDGKVLYSPDAIEIRSPNKEAFKRIEHMTAAKEPGRYTIRVMLRFKDITAQQSAAFEIR
jgi:hypothetical protein